MSDDEMEAKIEAFFLADGKWELEIDSEPRPGIIGGRWLWLGDANYGFRAIDLVRSITERLPETQKTL